MRLTAFGILLTAVLWSASAMRAAQSLPIDATITGRVIDGGTQAPIAGARVMLLPAPAAGRLTGPMGIPTQAVTGDDGVYTLRGIAAGRYRVQVQKPGFVSPSQAESSWFQVDAGQAIAGPDVRLVRGAVIAGRVLDARGDGLPELMVTAVQKATGGFGRGRGGAPAIPAGQPGQTNDIGEFRITGLPEGQYYVTASPRPASPFGESSTSGASNPITTFYPGATEIAGAQVITVAAGQTISGLEFTILSARGFTVSGVVVDEMNRPVGGAMVMLMPAQLAVVGPGPRGSGRTQADGTFAIGGVAPGAYRLNASVPVTVQNGGTTTSSGGGTVVTWGGTATAGVRGGVASGAGGLVTYSSSSGPASSIQVTVGDADVAGVTVVVRQR
jgi:protocatechuate 3,4-dioxygenase beta subunit